MQYDSEEKALCDYLVETLGEMGAIKKFPFLLEYKKSFKPVYTRELKDWVLENALDYFEEIPSKFITVEDYRKFIINSLKTHGHLVSFCNDAKLCDYQTAVIKLRSGILTGQLQDDPRYMKKIVSLAAKQDISSIMGMTFFKNKEFLRTIDKHYTTLNEHLKKNIFKALLYMPNYRCDDIESYSEFIPLMEKLFDDKSYGEYYNKMLDNSHNVWLPYKLHAYKRNPYFIQRMVDLYDINYKSDITRRNLPRDMLYIIDKVGKVEIEANKDFEKVTMYKHGYFSGLIKSKICIALNVVVNVIKKGIKK